MRYGVDVGQLSPGPTCGPASAPRVADLQHMDLDSFIQRWSVSGGAERANYGQFLSELCRVLVVPEPDPTRPDDADNAYVFERSVYEPHDGGQPTVRRIDLYRRGSFVLEAKQGVEKEAAAEEAARQASSRKAPKKKGHGTRGTPGWDTFMRRAREQAEGYVRLLPASEGRPPFVLVVDVGHAIEVYAEFTRTGGHYLPFPDSRRHRILLEDLRAPEVRERLRAVWLDPLSLDPSRHAARVTREVANTLADISRSMEGQPDAGGTPMTPARVSAFLMRMIFTMFAEDVGLIEGGAFRQKLESLRGRPAAFVPTMQDLWQAMAKGGYSVALDAQIKHFNGGLFEGVEVLPVTAGQLDLFIAAAEHDWSQVEPSIFGTLVERALDPAERHRLGAHYTPRAYVERLVNQVVLVPLREDWRGVQVEVQRALHAAGSDAPARTKARGLVERFLGQLQETRVLDPACGTGNFLYVAMELMKRLEAEVVETLVGLGGAAPLIGVNPEQFLGLELNPRAARVAELVLWIGYLQLYAREHGKASPPEPILRAFHNIRQADAVLAYDSKRPRVTQTGEPITRWDGVTYKFHPVTGQAIPDETATRQDEEFLNPRPAPWPRAAFIVGNPPFLGSKRMREVLGEGYVDALQTAWPHVPQATDFVLRWWDRAAQLVRAGEVRRFGLITTNSVSQTYNRRVIEGHLQAQAAPLSLVFAIPDHPWVDSADGAAVRVSMTVGEVGKKSGELTTVTRELEEAGEGDTLVGETRSTTGMIHPNLQVGANLTDAQPLGANEGLCAVGMKTIGAGFLITEDQADAFSAKTSSAVARHVRPYLNGRDLMNRTRGKYVIDFYGLSEEQVRSGFPELYQYLRNHVYDLRQQNNNALFREFWWVLGHSRPIFRAFTAGLTRYVVTLETAKHQVFQFIDASVIPDSTLVTFGFDDAYVLGVLSSRIHVVWALAQGGRLGVGNDPRYNKTRCFETFPFPAATPEQQAAIREKAEALDAHRASRLMQHPGLTMTGMYNVLEKLRAGAPLDIKEQATHDQGLVTTLRVLHDELDALVQAAYGWEGALTDQDILLRLTELNAAREQEERQGLVRHLRPEYQDPRGAAMRALELDVAAAATPEAERPTYPHKLAEQAAAVRQALQGAARPLTAQQVARLFKGARTASVDEVLETLVALGQARQVGEADVAYAA